MPLTRLELQLSLWAWYGRFSKTLQNGIIKWACKKYEVKKVKMLVTQSCPTLFNSIDGSSPGSSVQARLLEWVAISFSGGGGDLCDPGVEPRTPTLQTDSLPSESPGKPKNVYMQRSWRIKLKCKNDYLGWWDYRGLLLSLLYFFSKAYCVFSWEKRLSHFEGKKSYKIMQFYGSKY